MHSAIVCCDCPGIPQRARAACKVKVTREDQPVFAGHSAVSTLLDRLPQGTPVEQHIRACSKSHEKYAYYFKWDGDGAILKKYNLLTGRKVE